MLNQQYLTLLMQPTIAVVVSQLMMMMIIRVVVVSIIGIQYEACQVQYMGHSLLGHPCYMPLNYIPV